MLGPLSLRVFDSASAVAAVAVAGGGGGPGEMWVELGAADAALPTPVDPAELLRARIRRREDGAGMRLGPGRALGTEEDRICACKPLSKQGTAQRGCTVHRTTKENLRGVYV